MAGTGLEVTLHQGRERAEVTRFTSTLNEIVASLREIDRVYLLEATRATWVLAHLDHSDDDLIVRLEARPVPKSDRGPEDMARAVQALVDGVGVLQIESTVPPLFAPSTVRRVSKLSVPVDAGIQSVSLATYNGQVGEAVELNDEVREHADAAVKPFEESYGSVVGRVSALRDPRRGQTFKLTVRDERHGQAIDARLPQSMEQQARDAWRHRVLIGGKVKRNAQGQPIRIDADLMEFMPEGDAGRPSPDALLGVGADWLDGKTVDEYLSGVRDG